LFCFARNKVKEVIELTLSQQKQIKTKKKTERYRGKKSCQSMPLEKKKRLRKDGKARKKVAQLEFLSQKLILFTAFI
jgi:hypothetical protein